MSSEGVRDPENQREDILLTSKSSSVDIGEENVRDTVDDVKIVYSNIKDVTEKDEITDSIKLLQHSSETSSKHDLMEIDSSYMKSVNDSVEANVTTEEGQINVPISIDDVESLKVVGNGLDTPEIQERHATRTANLIALPVQLVAQDAQNDRPIEIKNSDQNELMQKNKSVENAASMDLIKAQAASNSRDGISKVEVTNVVNSLSYLAAEYASSDSDENEKRPSSPCEVITIVDDRGNVRQNNTQYRMESIDDDSESGSSSINSSGSDYTTETDSDIDSESDSPIRVSKIDLPKIKNIKSEFEGLPPIEELKITVPEESCDHLGEVTGFVEEFVIVRPVSGKPTLNLDSILFLEKGQKVLGKVFDVFGHVTDPQYCVRFNSEEHIQQSGIVLGMEVYYSLNDEHTSLVFLHELVKLKGADISGEDDMEPPEFSDDEEERAYNQLQRQKQRHRPGMSESHDNCGGVVIPQKRQCPERPRNPWGTDWRSQNYGNRPPNPNSGHGTLRWISDNCQPSFQNSPNLQNVTHSPNQSSPHRYRHPSTFNSSQCQCHLYTNRYQQNNMFLPTNPEYVFGQPANFRPNYPYYGTNFYRPNPYPHPHMSWGPPPPPPPLPPPPPPHPPHPPSSV